MKLSIRPSLRRPPGARLVRAEGLTLVELLVAMSLGLFVIGGVAAAYVANQRTRAELERDSRQIENGRYAVQLLADELRHAGFLGEFDPRGMPAPAALPGVCSSDLDLLRTAFTAPVDGGDDAAGGLACLPGLKPGTDVFVVRRASTCVAGTAGCAAVSAGEPYLQASLCTDPDELGSTSIDDRFALSTVAAELDRHQRDCTTPAALRRYLVRVYYVATENASGDAIPTLKRAELGAGGFVVEPLVEGVDNLQLEYGIDADATGGGSPEQYSTDPSAFGACSGAACIENWRNVTSVKIHLLARNTEPSPGFSDARTYVLGLTDAGADNEFGPFRDGYRRHAYSTVVRLNNVAGRRE